MIIYPEQLIMCILTKMNEFDGKLCYEINYPEYQILNVDLEIPWLKSCEILSFLWHNEDR